MNARLVLLAVAALPLAGCSSRRAVLPMPNRVNANEVAVYQALLRSDHTNSKHPEEMSFVSDETSPFDQETACDQRLVKQGVRPQYLSALRVLGEASYPIPSFDIGFARTREPWWFVVDGKRPPGTVSSYTFSRVAFSPDGHEAFLHVDSMSGVGFASTGFGYDLLAILNGASWSFRTVGCLSILN